MIYLGCPYRHEDFNVSIRRFEIVTEYTIFLMSIGQPVYSPITYTHPINLERAMPDSFWDNFSIHMLQKADEFRVLLLPGWELSKGLAKELEYWERYSFNPSIVWIKFREPNTFLITGDPR